MFREQDGTYIHTQDTCAYTQLLYVNPHLMAKKPSYYVVVNKYRIHCPLCFLVWCPRSRRPDVIPQAVLLVRIGSWRRQRRRKRSAARYPPRPSTAPTHLTGFPKPTRVLQQSRRHDSSSMSSRPFVCHNTNTPVTSALGRNKLRGLCAGWPIGPISSPSAVHASFDCLYPNRKLATPTTEMVPLHGQKTWKSRGRR